VARLLLLLAGLALLACIQLGNGQQKVPKKLWDTARAEGNVYILIELNVPWKPNPDLNSPEVRQQKKDIAAAQDQLLAELSGTNYKVVARWDIIPGMALQVDSSVLSLLERSKVVKSVTENTKNYLNPVPGRK
jgi:hypothetical protein